ncbi:MAG: hypothetical protein GY784_10650 [Gammaproteobacteria bacterium]|nr:hypothetical protein [Gammaproteobacteria bacterium]
MFSPRICLSVGMSLAILSEVVVGETIVDPMQPPAYALNKLRLAKLKGSGKTDKTQSTDTLAATPLLLSSILIAKDRKVAIINQQMLVVGERIGKAKLVKISKDSVLLLKNGKRIVLKLDNGLTAVKKIATKNSL